MTSPSIPKCHARIVLHSHENPTPEDLSRILLISGTCEQIAKEILKETGHNAITECSIQFPKKIALKAGEEKKISRPKIHIVGNGSATSQALSGFLKCVNELKRDSEIDGVKACREKYIANLEPINPMS